MPYGIFGEFGNTKKFQLMHDGLTLVFYGFMTDIE